MLNLGTVQDFHRVFLPTKHCAPLLAGDDIHLHIGPTLEPGYDAYVVSRMPMSRDMSFLEHLRSTGKRIIWSIDDDLWHINSSPVQIDLDIANWMKQIASEIWVSTVPLQQVVGRGTVLPNLIDTDFWPNTTRQANSPMRILWAGSAVGHSRDLDLVAGLYERILDTDLDVLCLFFGSYPSSMADWTEVPGSDMALKVPAARYGGRLGFIRPVPIEEYPSTLAAINPDVCVCALENTPFNRSRSNLKWLEYSMVGAVTIATDCEAYRGAASFDLNSWNDILWLLRNPEMARKSGQQVKDNVLSSWTWQGFGRDTWLEAFRQIGEL